MHDSPAAAELVQQAFRLARQAGKEEWWVMTIPVLKNRLLLLTKNSFREADFGATSFRDFLNRIPDVVSLIESPPPGFVVLKSASDKHPHEFATAKRHGERIRPDLWRAVLDYSSGQKYVWDASQRIARPLTTEGQGPLLPTISAADLGQWRADFLSTHKTTDPGSAKRAEEWLRASLPTVGLPAPLRPAWNNYLKRAIQRRLHDWFATNAIETPLITEGPIETTSSITDEGALRDFVISCVRAMSKRELLELRISPSAVMRALHFRGSKSGENDG